MKTLYFITSNKGKLTEAQERFASVGIDVVQKDIGYPELQAATLEEVAQFGVDHVRQQVNHPFILEDAGIFIDALHGFPGVYSSYVYHTLGLQGILRLLQGVPTAKRGATFRSVFAYTEPHAQPRLFIGECQGTVSLGEQGTQGFGYDPVFIPQGDTRTFAQMGTKEKNQFSHRGRSLEKLLDFFKKQ
ncbi:MAG: XTP/dITP diphosphatase [Candidatus Thermoplasmatota archaeon]|nr:XTP/dITP diphosphatase [Candidatus Thermoplasmatota archaeon]